MPIRLFARVKAPAVVVAAVAAVALEATGCASVTDPPLPGGAVAFAPPARYARWWTQAQACSGLTGDLAAVQWYVVPGADTIPDPGHADVNAYWSPASNRIVLGGKWARDGSVVRHEMLHALLGRGVTGHPAAYFQGRCAGWVPCTGECAAVPAPYPPPAADAPVLAPTDLRITVEASPAVVTRIPGDSGITVIVRAANPRAVPVWVRLVPPPGCSLACEEVTGFGAGIGAGTAATGVTVGEIRLAPGGRVPLPAGGAAVAVFDFDLPGFRPGAYLALGSFNVAGLSAWGDPTIAVPFQIAP